MKLSGYDFEGSRRLSTYDSLRQPAEQLLGHSGRFSVNREARMQQRVPAARADRGRVVRETIHELGIARGFVLENHRSLCPLPVVTTRYQGRIETELFPGP